MYLMGTVVSRTKGTSMPVGFGSNINTLTRDIRVNVVEIKNGTFIEPMNGVEQPTVAVTDFWKDQTVVLHVLRRFG